MNVHAELEKVRERVARQPSLAPDLRIWMFEQMRDRRGPFAFGVSKAGAVLPTAIGDWLMGGISGPKPDIVTIGRHFASLGCSVWRPTANKLWLLPEVFGHDHAALVAMGGTYWGRVCRDLANGNDPRLLSDQLLKRGANSRYPSNRQPPITGVACLYVPNRKPNNIPPKPIKRVSDNEESST